jgi:hypothetical protein
MGTFSCSYKDVTIEANGHLIRTYLAPSFVLWVMFSFIDYLKGLPDTSPFVYLYLLLAQLAPGEGPGGVG